MSRVELEPGLYPDNVIVTESTRAEIASSDGNRHSGNHRPAMQTDVPEPDLEIPRQEPVQSNRQPDTSERLGTSHQLYNQRPVQDNQPYSQQAQRPDYREGRRSLHPPEEQLGSRRSSQDNGRVQLEVPQSVVSGRSRQDFSQPHRLDYAYRRSTDPRGRPLIESRTVQPGLLAVDSQPRARASNGFREHQRRSDRSDFRGVSSATTQRSRGRLMRYCICKLKILIPS